tara:strand:+ start:107 stop:391 length:285 start_codon:yes stop_codon:yes gene_type:complete
MNYEGTSEKYIEENKNMMIPWYLMASYAYYEESDPIFTDFYYDSIARRMIDEWKNIHHFHKHLISLDDLTAGCYIGRYPNRIINALKHLRTCTN